MKLTSMQKMLAAIVAIALIAVLVIVFLIVPKFQQMSQLDADARAARDQVEQTKTRLAQLTQSASNASVTQSELMKLANQFPENPELPSLIIELQDAGNASGITFAQFTPGAPVNHESSKYSYIDITAEVQGTWSDVLDYVRRLNTMTRAIRVRDVTMTPMPLDEPTTETPQPETEIRLNFAMRVYIMAVDGGPPSSTAATAPVAAPAVP